MSYVRISPFYIAVQNTKLLFDVTFYTEDCVLHFENSFYRIDYGIDYRMKALINNLQQ